MRALRIHGVCDARLEDVDMPQRPSNEWVLVKCEAAGVCGTDKAFYLGSYPLFKKPLVPGHECVGIVVEGPSELIGHRVVPEINFACGTCNFCKEGLYTHCPYKKTLGIDFDGCMAEYFVAHKNYLHIADDLSPEQCIVVEPLAAIINALNQYPPAPYMKVAIIGCGNLALLLSQVLKYMGIEFTVIIRPDSPKRKILDSLRIDYVYLNELNEFIKHNTVEGQGFDMVFEVTGSNEGIDLAVRIARPRGIIHLKSTPGGIAKFNQTLAVVKELRIIASRCGTFREFEKAIDLIRRGIVKPIITHVMGLEEGKSIFEKALERDQVKVVVKPRSP